MIWVILESKSLKMNLKSLKLYLYSSSAKCCSPISFSNGIALVNTDLSMRQRTPLKRKKEGERFDIHRRDDNTDFYEIVSKHFMAGVSLHSSQKYRRGRPRIRVTSFKAGLCSVWHSSCQWVSTLPTGTDLTWAFENTCSVYPIDFIRLSSD